MRLQIRRLVGNEGVGGRVGFVEAVLGKFVHQVENRFGLFGIQFICLGSFKKQPLLTGHLFVIFLTHGAAQQVGLSERIAGQGAGNLHDLLLIDDDPVGILQDRLQLRQVVYDLFAAMFAVDEVIHHAGAKRAGAIQGAGGDNVFKAGWLQFDQHLLHAA